MTESSHNNSNIDSEEEENNKTDKEHITKSMLSEDEGDEKGKLNLSFLNSKRKSRKSFNSGIDDSYIYEKSIKRNILSPSKKQIKNNFSNNLLSISMDLDEDAENLFFKNIKSNNKNVVQNNDLGIHSNFNGEIKTNDATKINIGRKEEKNEIIPEENINTPEIKKAFRNDNNRIKIKKIVFKSFYENLNEKIKDGKMKIKELDNDKIKNISRKENNSLFRKKWKDLILSNSAGNDEIIKYIYENKEKDIIELLETTFGQYFDIFINNNWEQFAERERESQIKKYKQKKYKEIINEIISEKNTQILKQIKKYTTIGVKNKKGESLLDSENKEENIIEKFERHNYKIIKEKEFIVFIHSLNQYKNISFEISLKELDDINKHISVLKVLVNDFQKWIEKKPRKRTKKITKKFSVKKFKK